MVAWFKHDIPAWMDGTEGLSDGAYRAYHVICQLIYLNEGPIALNEHGIAGRCKQSIRAFRKNLDELLGRGKLTLENGRLANSRAGKELGKVETNRENAAKGGENSGKVRKSPDKPLENNKSDEATLQDDPSLKTRLEETRLDEKAERARDLRVAIVKAFEDANSPSMPDTSRAELWLTQGFDAAIIVAVVREIVAKNPGISSLNYFDKPIREAHERRATAAQAAQPVSRETPWPEWAKRWREHREWPMALGPDPGTAGCRCPADVLRAAGVDPETGEPLAVDDGLDIPPYLRRVV